MELQPVFQEPFFLTGVVFRVPLNTTLFAGRAELGYVHDVLFSRKYEFSSQLSPLTGLPQLFLKSYSKNPLRISSPEETRFRRLSDEEKRDGIYLDKGSKVEMYERGPIFLIDFLGSSEEALNATQSVSPQEKTTSEICQGELAINKEEILYPMIQRPPTSSSSPSFGLEAAGLQVDDSFLVKPQPNSQLDLLQNFSSSSPANEASFFPSSTPMSSSSMFKKNSTLFGRFQARK